MARYWEWDAPFKIDPKETALIIVDMQRGFVDEGFCFFTPDAHAQIPVIAEFKKFCNEKGIPVFLSAFVQDENYHNDFYWFRNKQRGLLNEDGSCKLRRGTPDGEITDALAPTGDDTYFTKYTYSCFAHTKLEEQLKAKGIRDANLVYQGGIFAIQKDAQMTMTQLITIAVGSCVCGCCSWAPDLMRFSKDYKTTTGVMAIGLGICGPFMLLIGIVGMLVYGQYDIAYILKEQGLLSMAFIGLFANIWSTAQGNAYSSSLNLASIFTKVKREKLLVIFGVIGTVIGLFGLYKYFGAWLSFLAKAMPHLDAWNWPGLVCYAIGVSTKWWLPSVGIPAINSFVLTMVLEAVCAMIWLRKRSDAVKAAVKHADEAVCD